MASWQQPELIDAGRTGIRTVRSRRNIYIALVLFLHLHRYFPKRWGLVDERAASPSAAHDFILCDRLISRMRDPSRTLLSLGRDLRKIDDGLVPSSSGLVGGRDFFSLSVLSAQLFWMWVNLLRTNSRA